MNNLERQKILANVAAEDFIGRTGELSAILRHCESEKEARGLLLLSAPALGASELLRQTYDAIFAAQGETIPVYFALAKSDKTARRAALRFVQTFLRQTVAFRRRDRKILDAASDVLELSELAVPSDGHWIDRIVAACEATGKTGDEPAFVRSCLSAPLRAAGEGARAFVMFDNLHEAEFLSGEIDFIEELKEIFSRSSGVSFVFAGHRRFLFGAMRTGSTKLADVETLELEPLNFSDAGFLAEYLAQKHHVKINDQTRDLIAVQTAGNPFFIENLFGAARAKNFALDSFQKVEKVYTDEIFGGATAKFYDAVFAEVAPAAEIQKHISGLLYDALTVEREKVPIESWKPRVGLSETDFYRAMRLLNSLEIVRTTSNLVEAMQENEVLNDYVKARFRLETIGESRALVVGETLSEFLKRAPQTMARFYRRKSAINLRELLSIFNCQPTPAALLDYSVFTGELKGAPDADILKYLAKEPEKIILPQITYTAHTVAFYPPIGQFAERERSAVAVGFDECKYTDEDEIVWIAAEIDSKLEAPKELAEFWCDRLEMVALMCNFLRYKIWLIATEGFSPDAVKILKQRNAYGSSRRQIDLLAKFLKAEDVLGEKIKQSEYEMVVPMGEDTELIAAHAVEEIARRYAFKPKAINQIKTALVEACINASEHSHSPDRKIYQKFTVEDDKIVITISNRGLRISDKKPVEITPDEGRRGWGLKLMKTLMDEVKFEQVDDGTRISMVKYMTK